ncbi:glutaredoxin 3 [Sphingopyxis alaskensis]|jgi:glutaredoxin 3|uniref:Glutaredoxin n=1 Tax=Sphingopyxis alaskensis (strain DSM 13593 / LMG 18877 / RB2256) TaxID=317655 RepID=Q1GS70_SPHAL|nr:glutaredoxin 3 [Sphingopyxis alaskensis]ABF53502.1 Glutaredoxin, GrxC [Sphingopyxis alaskensis RB2256]MCM3421079.1 glutaredoxin 3 [Sphingopyxis alaskensis]
MARIEVYTKAFCPYCTRAKRLLDGKGADFSEIDVTMDRAGFDAMVARAGGRRTVPQVFIDDRHVGGSDELAALDAKGELDALIGRA